MTPNLAVDLNESRYDRQERIAWWDQERLSSARVLVVGAGALGNEIVKNLALLGVGSVVVIDLDVVELSNLARCLFFRPEDEGRRKATTLAAAARALNPDVEITGVDTDVRAFGAGVFWRADVVVGALDNREARLFLNRLAWRTGRPWVDGAIEALLGVARVFSPPESCYECTLTPADFDALAHRQSCRLLSREDLLDGRVPTTATSAALIAAVEVQEVIKLLHRDNPAVRPLRDALVFDGINNDAYSLRYPFDPKCPAHHVFSDVVELADNGSLSFGDLVEATGLATGAIVELGDDYLTEWNCTTCSTSTAARGWIGAATFADAECPACGSARQPRTTTRVEVPGEWAGQTLAQFGVRDDEAFAIRRGAEYRYVWARAARRPGLPASWQ